MTIRLEQCDGRSKWLCDEASLENIHDVPQFRLAIQGQTFFPTWTVMRRQINAFARPSAFVSAAFSAYEPVTNDT